MAINSKSKIRDIIADPRAAAIIEEYRPGFASNPQLKMAMGTSLRRALAFPGSGFTKEQKAELFARLDALDE